VYNATGHPEVKKGTKSEDDMLTEFLQTFGSYCTNSGISGGEVGFDHFLDYYAYISASIDNDSYFQVMMQNAWKMYQPK
jgi:hypothetical protein